MIKNFSFLYQISFVLVKGSKIFVQPRVFLVYKIFLFQYLNSCFDALDYIYIDE